MAALSSYPVAATSHSSRKRSLRQRLFTASRKQRQAELTVNLAPASDQAQPFDQSSTSSDLAGNGVSTLLNLDQQMSPSFDSSEKRHKRPPFYRRKGQDTCLRETSAPSPHPLTKGKIRAYRASTSFFARVVHKVVPCVLPPLGPSTRDGDDKTSSLPSPALLPTAILDDHKDASWPNRQAQAVNSQDAEVSPSVDSALEIDDLDLAPEKISLPKLPAETVTSPPIPNGEPHISSLAESLEDRLIKEGGNGVPIGPDGLPQPLLPPIAPEHVGRKCLVLDLDETLVHSSFKSLAQPDFIVPVEIDSHWHHFHVLKRPGVETFLKEMGKLYEVVVFTASLSKYADPVLDKLDIHHSVTHRLFRESCFYHKGNYIKDLSQLGRPICDTIILDNAPASYLFHPKNAVPVSSWFNDQYDAELTDLIPFLADLNSVSDVRSILGGIR